MPAQSTSAPTPLSLKYGAFGRAPNPATPDPSRMFVVLVGPGGSGKTNLLMSVPGLLNINTDLSPPPRSSPDAPLPDCQFFPALNDDAQPVDFNGRPLVFTWEHVEELRAKLIEAAKNNAPRPKAVAIDSVSSALRMIQEYVTRNAVKLNLVKAEEAGRITEFWHMNGLAAYGRAYDILVNFISSLRQNGYGVFATYHITHTVMPIGENISTSVWEPAVAPGMWSRMFPMADMVLPVRQLTRARPEPIMQEVQGKLTRVGTRQISEIYYAMEFKNPALFNVTKRRVALPETVELPAIGGWEVFEKIYREAYGSPA